MSLHLLVPPVRGVQETSLVRGQYEYWHYVCDGVDDRGWGCGYRTLQTVISWIVNNKKGSSEEPVPSIAEIQDILVRMEDKPGGFSGSREWIGSVEVALVLDQLFDVPGKIVHTRSGRELEEVFEKLKTHFDQTGCPVMMGGDLDASSKGVFGTCQTSSEKYFLIVDPHFVKTDACETDSADLVEAGWAKWVNLDGFSGSSFYNLCLPQIKSDALNQE
eukprot:GFUD01026735.1.p1 GENE.GFUD01026735.1~~GFUD01026735.1.p1  ORF type:complete len:218 (-),score=60.16 GFUD01026735.1:93-746(-)